MSTITPLFTRIPAPVDHVEPSLDAAVAAYWANRKPGWRVNAEAAEHRSRAVRRLLADILATA